MFFDEILADSLGVGTATVILIAIVIFGIIIAIKDVKIGVMVSSLLLFVAFVVFFQYNQAATADWGPLLISWFVSIVLLFLMLLFSYLGYEDRRKVIN